MSNMGRLLLVALALMQCVSVSLAEDEEMTLEEWTEKRFKEVVRLVKEPRLDKAALDANPTCEDMVAHVLVRHLDCRFHIVNMGCGYPLHYLLFTMLESEWRVSQTNANYFNNTYNYEILKVLCPKVEHMGYKAFCEDPSWDILKGGCKQATMITLKRNPGPEHFWVPCNGSRPSQFRRLGSRCDRVYDCVDRSDEVGCPEPKNQTVVEVALGGKDLRMEPISAVERVNTRLSLLRRTYLNPRLFILRDLRHEECVNGTNGVMIDGRCFPINETCGDYVKNRMENRYFLHPQHISLCQNKAFWSAVEHHCEDRNMIPCNGNYPGFCRSSNTTPLMEMPPSWNTIVINKTFSFCPDLSNVIFDGKSGNTSMRSRFWKLHFKDLCPAPWDLLFCKQGTYPICDGLFKCNDGKTCIYENLVCDGHPQCEDGSDEDPDRCSKCKGRNFGFPRLVPFDLWNADFSCLHRDTKLPICARPCDGIDDFCEDGADEANCGLPSFFLLLMLAAAATLAASIIVQLIATIGSSVSRGKNDYNPEGRTLSALTLSLIAIEQSNESITRYGVLRSHVDFGPSLHNLVELLDYQGDLEKLEKVCKKYYALESEHNEKLADRETETELFFFSALKASRLTRIFYNAVDGRLKPSRWPACTKKDSFRRFSITTRSLFAVFLHYTDLGKDIYIAAKFGFMALNFDVLVESEWYAEHNWYLFVFTVGVFVSCLIVTQLADIVCLVAHREFKKMRVPGKVLSVVFAVFVPGYMQLKMASLQKKELQILNALSDCVGEKATSENYREAIRLEEAKLSSMREARESMQDLLAEFRANESVFQHYPVMHLLIALLVLTEFADYSRTQALPELIQSEIVAYTIGCLIIASINMLRGHAQHLQAKFRGHLSVATRALHAANLFASMGTTLALHYLVQMAPVYDLRSKYYKLDMRGRSAYDHWSRDSMPFVDVEDDKGITFEEVFDKRINHTVHIYPELRALEWSRFSRMPLVSFAMYIYDDRFYSMQEANSAYASFMALHGDFGLFFLLCLACLYYLQPKKGASFLVRVRSALYCFLCPTMMHDWTDLLRSGQENSVGAAWKRNLRAFALVVATNFVFILIVVWIPVAELHHYTIEVQEGLSEYLSLTEDELIIREVLTNAVVGMITLSVLLPALQIGVFVVYNKYGHPWSRLLAEVAEDKPDKAAQVAIASTSIASPPAAVAPDQRQDPKLEKE